jgi:hypothetical protein
MEAMREISGEKSSENTGYRILVILIVVVAGLSSAMKDLSGLGQLTSNIREFRSEWFGDGLVTASAKEISLGETSCTNPKDQGNNNPAEFRWSGRMAPGQSIEIKGINGGITAEPAGGEAEVVANKQARRSDPNAVRIEVVQQAGGVTICAIYPSDDSQQPNTCQPGDNSSSHNNVRNNDVQVNFVVRVPTGVDFTGRTVNGEITGKSLSGNVVSRTVNGSINISTSGYAQAKTVNGEISAKLGSANWRGSLEFKTVNGSVNLDLPSDLSTELKADTFNGEVSSDFPLSVLGTSSRKHVSGTIGSGGRELILKTLNGSINLRRVS